jgi:hypothetical protein
MKIENALEPDFNPIEQAFAQVEGLFPCVPAAHVRSSSANAAALGRFTPDECGNYVRHCGYRFAR